MLEFPSLAALLAESSESPATLTPTPTEHHLPAPPAQLVAGATSFTALLRDPPMHSVHTWGDARHNHLGRVLARSPAADNDSPSASTASTASTPHIVDHLAGIPVAKVAAGGWLTAALAASQDLYVWGGRPGDGGDSGSGGGGSSDGAGRIRCLPDVGRRPEDNAEVSLVDIGGGGGDSSSGSGGSGGGSGGDGGDSDGSGSACDVLDVAVGAGHIVALTHDGRLWAVGRGHNGQLGCGASTAHADDWIEMRLPPPPPPPPSPPPQLPPPPPVGGAVAAPSSAHPSRAVMGIKRVESVHCGPWSTLIVVSIGKNRKGNLPKIKQ